MGTPARGNAINVIAVGVTAGIENSHKTQAEIAERAGISPKSLRLIVGREAQRVSLTDIMKVLNVLPYEPEQKKTLGEFAAIIHPIFPVVTSRYPQPRRIQNHRYRSWSARLGIRQQVLNF